MKKLYTKIPKRLAKKRLGGHLWRKLNAALKIGPGDLISTCKGYNERVKTSIPIYGANGIWTYIVVDFDIELESGSFCSLRHCCTFPPKSKQEIVEYWKWFLTDEGKAWLLDSGLETWSESNSVYQAISNGTSVEQIFTDTGEITPGVA